MPSPDPEGIFKGFFSECFAWSQGVLWTCSTVKGVYAEDNAPILAWWNVSLVDSTSLPTQDPQVAYNRILPSLSQFNCLVPGDSGNPHTSLEPLRLYPPWGSVLRFDRDYFS